MKSSTPRLVIARGYNPLEDPAGLDRADLERRYGQGERRVNIDD